MQAYNDTEVHLSSKYSQAPPCNFRARFDNAFGLMLVSASTIPPLEPDLRQQLGSRREIDMFQASGKQRHFAPL